MPPIPQLNPNMMQQAGMVNPFAPPPPSPTLGFPIWAQDARNAMKVQPSMTDPGKLLQPGASQQPQMASSNPPPVAPMASSAPPVNPQQQQLGADTAELRRLQQTGAGLNQIQNKPLRVLSRIGDIAAPFLLGRGAMAIPGTTAHNLFLQDQQQGRVAQDQSDLQAQAQLADTQSQTQQRAAEAAKKEAQAESYQPVMLTPEQAGAIGYPDWAGTSMDPRHLAALMQGKQKTDSAKSIATDKNTTTETVAQGRNQTQAQIASDRNARISALADAANKTKLLLQDKKDATSTANTGARIAAKGTPGVPGAAGGKVPADVTKRAALAGNVIENADAITGIINAHPEIVGPAGGRYSNVQQMIGSDDTNIQELGVRMHNVALASNGAHGLRSAEAVAQTEKELFNNFKTGPHGIAGGLKGLTDSVQTFLQDESNFQTSGRRTGNAMQPPAQGGAPKSYAQTATGANGHKIGSNDGDTWYDVQTGKKVQ